MKDLLQSIEAVVTDVDGVLTDGAIVTSENGGETKHFNVRDGLAIKLLQASGIQVAILSGRRSAPVDRRAAELGIGIVKTGRVDKQTALEEIAEELRIPVEKMAYIGDDLPDLAPIHMAALGCCPADAVEEVQQAADLVIPIEGGKGVFRYLAEIILKAHGKWPAIVSSFEVK